MCEVRSRENWPRTKKKRNKKVVVGNKKKWKNAGHPVDRTANWCIGGCWFTLALSGDVPTNGCYHTYNHTFARNSPAVGQ
jgi:hypothetical protein